MQRKNDSGEPQKPSGARDLFVIIGLFSGCMLLAWVLMKIFR